MASPELEIDLTALTYLVTVVIRRLNDIDSAWCHDLLKELRTDRLAASPSSDILFAKAIGIVERAIAEENPPKSAVVKDRK